MSDLPPYHSRHLIAKTHKSKIYYIKYTSKTFKRSYYINEKIKCKFAYKFPFPGACEVPRLKKKQKLCTQDNYVAHTRLLGYRTDIHLCENGARAVQF